MLGDLLVVTHVSVVFYFSQVQVRSRFGLVVHIERSHSTTHQGFWVSMLVSLISDYDSCL